VTIYTTEDAYVAFVAGRISRDEFFQVCSVNAERDRRPVIDALEERERSSSLVYEWHGGRGLVCRVCGSSRSCRCC
jgi:hypothetical protein